MGTLIGFGSAEALGVASADVGREFCRVRQQTEKLGRLVNRMRPCEECERWTFGAGALMRNLSHRGLI